MTYLQHKNGVDHRFSYITHHYVKHKGYYMAARRYEISLQVFKNSEIFSA